jgi:uncharacterized membrane protein
MTDRRTPSSTYDPKTGHRGGTTDGEQERNVQDVLADIDRCIDYSFFHPSSLAYFRDVVASELSVDQHYVPSSCISEFGRFYSSSFRNMLAHRSGPLADGLMQDQLRLLGDQDELSDDFRIAVLRILAESRPELFLRVARELLAREHDHRRKTRTYKILLKVLSEKLKTSEADDKPTDARSWWGLTRPQNPDEETDVSALELLAESALDDDSADNPEAELAKILLSERYSGSFAHPNVLSRLDQVIKDGAERGFRLTEREQEHRHECDRKLVDCEVDSKKREAEDRRLLIILTFVFLLLALGGAIASVLTGHPAGAGIVGGSAVIIAGLATVFLKRRHDAKTSTSQDE